MTINIEIVVFGLTCATGFLTFCGHLLLSINNKLGRIEVAHIRELAKVQQDIAVLQQQGHRLTA